MSDADREKWDERYSSQELRMGREPKTWLRECEPALPRVGSALDIACGEGQTAVWLAQRGLEVRALDISTVALAKLGQLAIQRGVQDQIEAMAWDLDDGLPPDVVSRQWELVTCFHFRDPELLIAAAGCLTKGGLLVAEVLSSASPWPGESSPSSRYLAGEGELLAVAERAGLEVVEHREEVTDGRAVARLLAGQR